MKSLSRFIVSVTMVVMIASLLTLMPATVQAKKTPTEVKMVRDFYTDQLPEGIAIDKIGNMYVSIQSKGEVWRIRPDGEETLLLSIPTANAFGLAVDARGNVYATYAFGTAQGVYNITKHGSSYRISGTENIRWANALAFDERGNLYVTDTWNGAIWRVTPGGSAQLWIQHTLLYGLDSGAGKVDGYPPIGANGIQYWRGGLYVANTEKGLLVYVPILKHGDAGTPRVIAGDIDKVGGNEGKLYGLDGIALDVHGNVYGASVLLSQVVKIDPVNGEVQVILTAADGLSNPASLAFGTGKHDRETLFFTNFSVKDPSFGFGPAVLKLGLCVPGLPLP
jgi:sugar lactone lactonase YvrE